MRRHARLSRSRDLPLIWARYIHSPLFPQLNPTKGHHRNRPRGGLVGCGLHYI